MNAIHETSEQLALCLTPLRGYGNIGGLRCGVEQWQLVGLITRRSQVQVLPPLLKSANTFADFLYIFLPDTIWRGIYIRGNPHPLIHGHIGERLT